MPFTPLRLFLHAAYYLPLPRYSALFRYCRHAADVLRHADDASLPPLIFAAPISPHCLFSLSADMLSHALRIIAAFAGGCH